MSNKIIKKFRKFLCQETYPCIGAKAAEKKKLMGFFLAGDLNSSEYDLLILKRIYQFINNWHLHQESLQTFVVIFETPLLMTELHFEQLLWARLQSLHTIDAINHDWDSSISSVVTDANFSFSLGGEGFFIVGMHHNSSRKARKFIRPALVFNLHKQFEALRREGIYDLMRDQIRLRDVKYSGSLNPMLNDFGDVSESIQYSGRNVPTNHRCPFELQKNNVLST